MQASFYVSGFLYSLKTHQILLLESKHTDIPSLYSTLGGESLEGEQAQVTFQRIISKLLNINLKPKNIYPIYDYFSNISNKPNFVFYAEVGNTKKFTNLKTGLSWFTFGETIKLPFTSQTKQDLVVGQRVIAAKWRDDEAKRDLLTS